MDSTLIHGFPIFPSFQLLKEVHHFSAGFFFRSAVVVEPKGDAAFNHFLHLLAIVARVVEDGFERGVLFDLLEDRVLFALKKLHIIGLFLEAVLQGVADRNVVMNEGDDGFGVLIHLFLLSRGPYLSADGYR